MSCPDKERMRAETRRLVADFLARGGIIVLCPPCMSGLGTLLHAKTALELRARSAANRSVLQRMAMRRSSNQYGAYQHRVAAE